MKIFKTLREFNDFRVSINKEDIGFVPTMGNLHKGHISLIEHSFLNNSITVVSIFVNPTQFGPNEDFAIYPRTLYKDCEEIHGLEMKLQRKDPEKEIIVFSPDSMNDVYPEGFSTKIIVSGVTDKLCGVKRPNHFEGVTIVVYKLFSLVNPKIAYFGKKDYQQFIVIKKMVRDLSLPVEIESCPIIRAEDGLALSSRNQYLTPPEREKALILPKTINASNYLFSKNSLKVALEKFNSLKADVMSKGKWEYLEVYDAESLEPVTEKTISFLIAGAYQSTAARLIDNTVVKNNYV
ncbi:MAG: pantoate--beta-alanine ligase [Bacteriovoracaceae bacterium]|jgi:pantoate--beta-alanine ligase|nr:pantoate--beta-alanine ligase [Bacteriovoracaceae bacterium]